jgi:hypothetical protein
MPFHVLGAMPVPTWNRGRRMTPTTDTYGLTPTRGQADYLLHIVTVAERAIAEHNRTGWLPGGQGDATLMTTHLQAMRGAVSLEHPLRDLATWLKQRG